LVTGNLLNPPGNTISMEFAHGLERLQNHERQGALEKVFVTAHGISYLQPIVEYRYFYWLAIGKKRRGGTWCRL
jgi:hypothetical protein